MYQLSPNINSDKIFIVGRSDLGSRIDPYYFNPSFAIIAEKLSGVRCSTLKKESIKIFSGITPKSGGDDYTSMELGVPFIRSGDFTEDNQIDFDDLNFIKKDVHQNLMKGSQLKKGDLLIAIVGATIGKVGIYDFGVEANINQAICAIRLKEHIEPHFVHIFLLTSLGQKIIDRLKRPVARANINLKEIETIPIPLLDKKKQQIVIDYYHLKVKEKKEKENAAKNLLEGIDSYLLTQLGCSSPSLNNNLSKRIFKLKYSELHNRIDPIYYNSDLGIFNLGKYTTAKIGSVAHSFKSGMGAGKQDQATDDDGIIQIRPTNLKDHGFLNFEKNIYVPKESVKLSELVKYDDVLFNNTNSQEVVGKTAIVKTEDKLSFSNHITRIRVDINQITPDYLCIILNAYQRHRIFYSICTNWNNQSGVGLDLLKSLKIPLPSIEKQNEISKYIQDIYYNVKNMQEEARIVIENAKKEIEHIIINKE